MEIAPPGVPSEFIPFTKAAVPEVDIKGGRAVIDPPEVVSGAEATDEGTEPEAHS